MGFFPYCRQRKGEHGPAELPAARSTHRPHRGTPGPVGEPKLSRSVRKRLFELMIWEPTGNVKDRPIQG